MGFLEDAKDVAGEAAKKVGRAVEDGVDKAKDKIDEIKADSDVKAAEAKRDSVHARNEAKDNLRD